jgi:uncharacterized oxidoreductase
LVDGQVQTEKRYPWRALHDAALQLFRASGSPEEEAALLARLLTNASLSGAESHGLSRIPQYLGRLRNGAVKAGQRPELTVDRGCAALVSGNHGYGQVMAHFAVSQAIERTAKHGMSVVGLVDVGHIGRLGDFASMAAEAGLVCLVFASSGGVSRWMAPFNGKQAMMGTNPRAAAFPSDRSVPVVFDFATSAVANGKIQTWKKNAQSAPEGVLIDADGNPTTDPNVVGNGGAILPLGGPEGGHKGFGIAFMVEIMSGILTVGAFAGGPDASTTNNVTTFMTIDAGIFRDVSDFKQDMDRFIRFLKDTPAQEGKEIRIPGETSGRTREERRRDGIPLSDTIVAGIQAEFDSYGVAVNLCDLAT